MDLKIVDVKVALEDQFTLGQFTAKGTFVIMELPNYYIEMQFKSECIKGEQTGEKFYSAGIPFPCYFKIEFTGAKDLLKDDKAILTATDPRIVPDVVVKALSSHADVKALGKEHHLQMLQELLSD